MAELWESEEFQGKLKKLPLDLQERFLQYLEEMYDEESEEMLDFIRESRAAMANTATEMKHEQKALKETSDILASGRFSRNTNYRYRMDSAKSRHSACSDEGAVNNYLTQKYRASNTPVNFDYEVENKLAVERYMRKRDKGDKEKKREELAHVRDGSPESQGSYVEETAEIMQDVARTTSRMENERERQAELVRQRKERRREKKEQAEAMAREIMSHADNMENAKQRDKERQEQILREKLEEKKKKKKKKDKDKDKDREGEEGAEGGEDEDGEKKKKKKKKDKDKDKEEGEEDGEKKKKKKKKDKDKDNGEDEDGDKKEKKKKKKKDKDKEKEEAE